MAKHIKTTTSKKVARKKAKKSKHLNSKKQISKSKKLAQRKPRSPEEKQIGVVPSVLRALEPRVLLDAAAIVTGVEGLDSTDNNSDPAAIDASTQTPVTVTPPSPSQESTSNQQLSEENLIQTGLVTVKEVVFVDTQVEDYQTLLNSINIDNNFDVVILQANENGVEQIAKALADKEGIETIHIISHGSVGELQLGTARLNLETIQGQYADELQDIGGALTETADILIYGCDFGKGESGIAAADALASSTKADIAASTDITGSAQLGGDWDLELAVGEVDSELAFNTVGLDYDHTLATVNITATDAVASETPELVLAQDSNLTVTQNALTTENLVATFAGAYVDTILDSDGHYYYELEINNLNGDTDLATLLIGFVNKDYVTINSNSGTTFDFANEGIWLRANGSDSSTDFINEAPYTVGLGIANFSNGYTVDTYKGSAAYIGVEVDFSANSGVGVARLHIYDSSGSLMAITNDADINNTDTAGDYVNRWATRDDVVPYIMTSKVDTTLLNSNELVGDIPNGASFITGNAGQFEVSLDAVNNTGSDISVDYTVTGTAQKPLTYADYTPATTGDYKYDAPKALSTGDEVVIRFTAAVNTISNSTETTFSGSSTERIVLQLGEETASTDGLHKINLYGNSTVLSGHSTVDVMVTLNKTAGTVTIESSTGTVTFNKDLTNVTHFDLKNYYALIDYSNIVVGGDYKPLSGTAIIASGQSSAMIDVGGVIDDGLLESNETVIVTLKDATGYTLGANTTATVTIGDNDTTQVSITANDATATETTDLKLGKNSTSTIDKDALTIVSPTDSTWGAGYIDNVLDSDGHYYYELQVDNDLIGDDLATLLVGFANKGHVEQTGTSFDLANNGIWLRANGADSSTDFYQESPHTVALGINADSYGTGYNAQSNINALVKYIGVEADFSANSSEGIARLYLYDAQKNLIAITEDAVINSSGTGNIINKWSDKINVVPYIISTSVDLTFVEEANKVGPTPTGATYAVEKPDPGQFTVDLGTVNNTGSDITVNYTVNAASTATSGDYTALPGTVVIANGERYATIDVSVVDDTLLESAETVTVTLDSTDFAGATVNTTASANIASVTIADNETTQVSIAATDAIATEVATGGTADAGQFTVDLGTVNNTGSDITVNYTVTGTAVSGDYTALPGTAVILAGERYATIDVTVLDDTSLESAETVTVTLDSTDFAGAIVNTTASANIASVTIADNETTQVSIAATDATATEVATGGTADAGQFTVDLGTVNNTGGDITVNYTVTGTAASGDYTALPGTAVILAGERYATIDVTVLDDISLESAETVTVTLDSTDFAGATVNTTASANIASVTIADNETTQVSIAATDATATEVATGGTADAGQFTVDLGTVNNTGSDITVNYTVTGTAASGDYTALPGTVVIANGERYATIDVTVLDDISLESAETVTVTLDSTDFAGATVNTTASANIASVTIADNETTQVSIAATDATATEVATGGTADAGQFTVDLGTVNNTGGDITVNYTVTGTAASGDYTALPGTAVILAGERYATIDVKGIGDDTLLENNETVTVSLTSTDFAGATVNTEANANVATVTILENGTSVGVNATDATASEVTIGGTDDTGQFTIDLGKVNTTGAPVRVSYSLAGSTATAGSDYTSPENMYVDIADGSQTATIDLTVIDDQLPEDAEAVTVTINGITSTSNAADTFTIDADNTSTTVTIADNNDTSVVSISADTNAAEAGVNGKFTVSLSEVNSFSYPVVINYTVSGTATAGSDYAALSGSVSIPAGEQTATIDISGIVDDSVLELNETIELTLDGTNSQKITVAEGVDSTASINLIDNDNLSVEFSEALVTGAEEELANNLPTKLLIKGTSTVDRTVYLDVAGGSANDYTTGIITIPAGEYDGTLNTAIDLPLALVNDDIAETNEVLTLSLNQLAEGLVVGDVNLDTITISESQHIIGDATDNNGLTWQFAGNSSVSEGGTIGYAITLTNKNLAPDQTAQFNIGAGLTVVDLSLGATYSSNTGILTLEGPVTNGALAAGFGVYVADDSVYQGDRTLTMTVASVDKGVVSAGTVNTTVIENDKEVVEEVVAEEFVSQPDTSETMPVQDLISTNIEAAIAPLETTDTFTATSFNADTLSAISFDTSNQSSLGEISNLDQTINQLESLNTESGVKEGEGYTTDIEDINAVETEQSEQNLDDKYSLDVEDVGAKETLQQPTVKSTDLQDIELLDEDEKKKKEVTGDEIEILEQLNVEQQPSEGEGEGGEASEPGNSQEAGEAETSGDTVSSMSVTGETLAMNQEGTIAQSDEFKPNAKSDTNDKGNRGYRGFTDQVNDEHEDI